MEDNKTISSLTTIDNSIENMLAFGEKLIKSGLTPMKKPEDVMAAILYGKELGFSPMVAVNNIHSINGRASVGIHLITGLLLKAGITYDIIEDYVPLYRYKDKSGNYYTTDTLNECAEPKELIKDTVPYDVRTKIKFKRKVKQIDGTYEAFEITQSYCRNDAATAGLLDKDNWKRMLKIMMRTRCLTLGARLIAPDLLLGMNEHTELGEITNIKVKVSENGSEIEEGTVTILENEEQTKEEQTNVSGEVSADDVKIINETQKTTQKK